MVTIKKSISILLAIAMVLCLLPAVSITAAAEGTEITTWAQLQAAIDAADNGATITLARDYTALESDDYLTVPADRTIVLDLNGYTLDRGLSDVAEPATNGHVILVRGTLTIKDSSADGTGKITGGFAKNGGGVNNSGTLYLQGGSITGNRAMHTGNTTEGRGGGIMNYGALYMTGGSVTNNTGYLGGGICFQTGSNAALSASLTGGNISCNTASYGGGICINESGNGIHLGGTDIQSVPIIGQFDFGGIKIIGNDAAVKGGGLYCAEGATFYVKDSPVINNNRNGNIWLNGSSVITVEGELGEAAKLDIVGYGLPRAVTSGFNTNSSKMSKFTFAYGSAKAKNENGEIVPDLTYAAEVSTWDELQTVMNDSANNGMTIALSADLDGTNKDRLLLDGSDKNITIDLAGHKVEAHYTDKGDTSHVFEAKNGAALEIVDSVGGSTITGGWANNGGGIYVNDNSSVILRNVTVESNKADKDGGGIYVKGTLDIFGGSVSANEASDNGGGIYCYDYNVEINLYGVTISGNTAKNGGGGMNIHLEDDAVISGCLITDNSSTDSDGGGISVSAANKTLTVTNTIIDNNNAGSEGGGVYIDHGTVNFTGGSISGNSGKDCGGIYLTDNDAMTLTNVLIRNNISRDEGGAGVNNKGTATLTNCDISSNTAQKNGGGVFTDGTLTMTACTLNGNRSSGGDGGAIYLKDGTLNLYGSTITDNRSRLDGGGIFVNGDADAFNIKGRLAVYGNDGFDGDDLYLLSGKKITLTGALLSGSRINVALKDTSGTFTSGYSTYNGDQRPDLFFVPLDGYSVQKDSSGEAKIVASDWTLLQEQISNAQDGDTIVLRKNWTASSFDTHLVFSGNKSVTLDLAGHEIDRNCSSADGNGEVITVRNGVTLTIIDSVGGGMITGGYGVNGGGVYVNENAALYLEGGNIEGNRASTCGGGIYNKGTVNISGGDISGNSVTGTASGCNGGGIWNSSTLTITGGTISGNYAGYDGGGIYTENSLNISGGTISDNTARLSGGAVRIQGGDAFVSGGTFTGNTATNYHGGAFYIGKGESTPGNMYLTGGTISGNTAGLEGGAILVGNNGDAALYVSGAPTVTGSSAPQGSNIYLRGGNVVNVTGTLDESAKLDISAQQTGRALTSGLNGNGNLSNLSYNGNAGVLRLENGEAFIPEITADLTVSTWDALQEAMNDSANNGKTIVLSADLDGTGKDRLLLEGSNKNITIELAGHSVNLKRTSSGSSKHVFEAKSGATLKIIDSYGTGIITGGWETDGGGIYVNTNSTVILENVNVIGNKAGKDGGGIYVWGTLEMTGGSVLNNTADDNGGGIYVENTGTIRLRGVRISDNISNNDGGGMNIHVKDDTSTITECTISGNTCKNESGGGLVFNESGREIKLENSIITGNTCDDNGGGILVQSGSVRITGENNLISDNSARDGGGIFSIDGLIIENGTIQNNFAEKDGGGIYSRGTTTISGGEIIDNTADKSGGAMRIKGGTVTISGGEMSTNYAHEYGGAIYLNDGTLCLYGGTITLNEAELDGGGVYVADDTQAIKVSGSPEVDGNEATVGSDIMLTKNKIIIVDGTLDDDADLAVTLASDAFDTPFTTGYTTAGNTKAPENFFTSNDGYHASLLEGEVVLNLELDDAHQFIDSDNRINLNVNSKNWMSGISGERRLNEINIPSSHDSGMKSVHKNWADSVGSFFGGWGNAIAQRRFIDEQLNEGIRFFDLRLNHQFCYRSGLSYITRDDGENLWICHGENAAGGTYWARDHEEHSLSLNTVLTWVKDFLTKHPTEVVILEFSPEHQDGGKFERIYRRINKIIKELAKEKNPSTNDYFLYMEDGSLGRYTDYPKLKDCRGKILIKCDGLDYGIVDYSMGEKYRSYQPEGDFKDGPTTKVRHVTEFYNAFGGVSLPTTATDGFDIFYKIGTNSAPAGLFGIPTQTPLSCVDEIHPQLFKDGGVFDKRGEYLGWVVMDGAVAKVNKYVWKSNFFDGLDYCEVIAQSGLTDQDYSEQSFKLLRNTTITIPQNIYDVNQQALGKNFAGWLDSNGTLWTPGQAYTVTGDVTFTAQWDSETKTLVQIVWKDGDNKDDLRPDTLTLSVNNSFDFTLNANDSWSGIYNGSINSIEPVGLDKYACSFSSTSSAVTVTLTHTPQDAVTVSGTVTWDDEDDPNVRPDSVTLHLLADDEEVYALTVSGAEAWRFDFGTYPAYLNGEKIEYTITEDTIDGYYTTVNGFTVINQLDIEKSFVPVGITWVDNENAGNTRPESVRVDLLMGSTSVQWQDITPNVYGEWIYEFDVTAYIRNDPNAEFSVAADGIPGYTCTVDTSEGFYNIILTSTSIPAFKTQALILSGQIGVVFYMNLPAIDGVNYSQSYMTFSVPHGPCTDRADYDPTVVNRSQTYYGFKCYINAIQMAEPITATFHYTQDGVEKTMEKTYAVNDYFTSFENAVTEGQITDATTIDLVRALADYGHYVQPFLAQERHWTLGSDYATLETHYTESYKISEIHAAVTGKAFDASGAIGGDIAKITHSLTLDSDTVINVYFKPADGYSGSFTAAVDNGTEAEYSKGADGRYCVQISGISAHELSGNHTVTFTTASGTATVTVSALSYVNSALNYYTGDEDAQNAVAALYAYSQAADAYKAEHPNG